MNDDAVAMAKKTETVIARIAAALGLPHMYCDPDTRQRGDRGIQDDQRLELVAWSRSWSKAKLRTEIATAHDLREHFWLECLAKWIGRRTLLVCGADHVQSFKRKAIVANWAPRVIRQCWLP